jgi:hypothetical protein
MREPVLNTLNGLGTGTLREHYDKIVKAGGRLYLSGGSCAARGVSDADIQNVSYEKAGPPALVRLAVECDRTIVY